MGGDLAVIRLEPWGKSDLRLLEQCVGDPMMMKHLGGPERPEKIAERQARYEKPGSKQYKIIDVETGEGVGWVGYWEREWQDDEIYEIGWAVIPAFQGRGIAGTATREGLSKARAEQDRQYVHAYPSVENAPSNAICRKVGFTLLGAVDFEFPKGNWLRCNDWRYDLFAGS